jgi:uncharacterized membrane protein YhfC
LIRHTAVGRVVNLDDIGLPSPLRRTAIETVTWVLLLIAVLVFLALWVWVVVSDHRPLVLLTAFFVVACGCLLAALVVLGSLFTLVGLPD